MTRWSGLCVGSLTPVQAVDGVQLGRDLGGRAGHAGQAQVAAEEALEGDAGQRARRLGERNALLGLDHLVQAALPAAALQHAAGVLVDDLHLAVDDDVVLVAVEEVLGPQRLAHEMFAAPRHAPDAPQAFGGFTHGGQAGGLEMQAVPGRVDAEVLAQLELGGDLQRLAVVGRVGWLALALGQDERRARLVDEDGIGLVHDGEMQAAQQQRLRQPAVQEPRLHLRGADTPAGRDAVAQVVEHQALVGAVGDGPLVGLTLGLVLQRGPHHASGEAEEAEQRLHQLGIAPGQVVVDGDDMGGQASGACDGGGQARRQRLALAGLHLGEPPFDEDGGAHQLRVEGAFVQAAAGAFANEGHDLGEAGCAASLHGGGGGGEEAAAQFSVRLLLDLGLQPTRCFGHGAQCGHGGDEAALQAP